MLNRLVKIATTICFFAFGFIPSNAQQKDPCALPPDLQLVISHSFPGAKLVTVSDLSEDDKKFYVKDHGNNCPGLTRVNFYGDGNPTLALVLSEGENQKQRALLVVARQEGQTWKTKQLDAAGSSIPVVWSQKPGKYTSVYGDKSLKATNPVVVFCGYESWAVVYAWINNKVEKVWLMD